MPTYEYRCQRCGVVEVSQAITTRALSRCPLCGRRVHRLVSGGAGFIMDASGFWEMGKDGRERKVSRGERERQWLSAASNSRRV